MSSEYRIHRPYVVATLPRPLHSSNGNITAREVYGQVEGGRKRKRTELVVGIDGETTSLYDIPASKLITSYPVPPQESFVCAPYSIRIRTSGSSDRSRYTYLVTKEATSQSVTLFKDVVHHDGKTSSTSQTQSLQTSRVMHINCVGLSGSAIGDVTLICENGEVVSLSGETLEIRWTASAKSIVQDMVTAPLHDFQIEFATSSTLRDCQKGIFKHRPETLSALPKGTGPDTELIIIVSRSSSHQQDLSHISVLWPSQQASSSGLQNLTPLDVTPLPPLTGEEGSAFFQIDPQTASLLKLQDSRIAIYDLSGSLPKLKSVVQTDGAESVLPLSRPFILSCSRQSIRLYNHLYRSVHAKASLDVSDLPVDVQDPQACQLITYLRSQQAAIALVDNLLVAIQVEPPKQAGKRRKEGLLIDSIGRGAALEISSKRQKTGSRPVEFSKYVPGSIIEDYIPKYEASIEKADTHLSGNDMTAWESMLRKKFQISKQSHKPLPNGHQVNGDIGVAEIPDWEWLPHHMAYPAVDRRWVLYAISRVFSIERSDEQQGAMSLRLLLPDSNVAIYLVVAGHLTMSNLKSAFRDELEGESYTEQGLAASLINCLQVADPSLNLLLNYIEATSVGETELLLAIRALMLSMDLIADDKAGQMRLLKNEAAEEEDEDMDLDNLERELAITEHHLGDDCSSRSRGLTLAFTKLWRLPAQRVVKALRTSLKTTEVLSLVYVLRVELVRGAWTSIYIDPTSFDSLQGSNEPPPDGVITLIADLLSRCIDAIGSGGWLFNDAVSFADPTEATNFLTALKLEVTAALEGIEEAVYLNGVVSEAARYNAIAQKAVRKGNWTAAKLQQLQQQQQQNNGGSLIAQEKPLTVTPASRESQMLPLGLKVKTLVSKEKIVSGGEVVSRSARETGHLISQRVEAYSLEKLVV